MANLLTITKEANDFFTFVLNGDVANAIKNTRNDLTMVGDQANFKTANGANLIQQQNILFGNVTIIDGVTTLIPTSPNDLFDKLISVNFFDWITAGTGGVNRFDDLLDTFQYFGKDGQSIRVNESQLKLEPFELPNTDYLDLFPTPLIANKILKVNNSGTVYEFVDLPEGVEGLAFTDFGRLIVENDTFLIPEGKTAIQLNVNGANWYPLSDNNALEYNTFTQVGTDVITKTPLELNNYVVIFYQ